MGKRVTLEVLEGPMAGEVFVFDEHDNFLLGRSPECHISLPHDEFVSRHHFLLEVCPPIARLRDLGSLNGTFVNGTCHGGRVKGESPSEGAKHTYPQVDLCENDEIQVGLTTIGVRVESGSPSTPELVCSSCGKTFTSTSPVAPQATEMCPSCRGTVLEGAPVVLSQSYDAEESGETRRPFPFVAGLRILSEIGKGGMGAVYLAQRLGEEAEVALKVVLPRVALDEYSTRTFLREMELLETLDHPNIVKILDGSTGEGVFYFVMEYCNSGSLSDHLRAAGGKITLTAARSLFLDLLAGMAYAHDRGFVHRDIKPDNVLLHTTDSHIDVKMGDFGLAKSFEKAGLSGLTATNTVAGTCNFMPREQLTNYKYVRPTSDVWSLAATMYYALTGCYPRNEDPARDPLEIILNDESVPIRERDPDIPEAAAAVIDRALRSVPEERYENAAELAAALRHVLPESKS